MKYIETNSTDPYYNLAFEEYVLTHCKDTDYLMLWQNSSTIEVGANQNPLTVIDMGKAQGLNIQIVRRSMGGGPIYYDLGSLNFSYVTDWDPTENSRNQQMLEPITNAFLKMGLDLETKDGQELLLNGRTMVKSVRRLLGKRILYHGTILVHSDLIQAKEMFNTSPDNFTAEHTDQAWQCMTNLQEHVFLEIEEVKNLLLQSWLGFHQDKEVLTKTQLNEVKFIADHKYRAWNWNCARSSKFQFKNIKRFDDGTIEIHMDIVDGNIKKCMINGDFLSLLDIREVESQLTDVHYDSVAVERILSRLPFELYFGSLIKEEVLCSFFE